MVVKICRACKEEKDVSEFYKQESGKFGVMGQCKECRKKQVKKYRGANKEKVKESKLKNYIENRDYYRIYKAEYYLKHKEELQIKYSLYRADHKDEISKFSKEYYIINKEIIKNRASDYYYDNKDDVLMRSELYRKFHKSEIAVLNKKYRNTPIGKEKHALDQVKRRSKAKGVECTLTHKQWKRILQMQNNRCADCGREFGEKLKSTKDHIIPLSMGGPFTMGNIRALCGSCNSKKLASVYFMKAISELIIPREQLLKI